MTHDTPKDSWLFGLLCVLLLWAPIPLGSGRLWSAAILNIGYGIIALGLAWQLARGTLRPSPALRHAWPVLLLFLGIPLVSAIQALPLLPSGSISQDVSATLFRMQAGLGYALLFGICLQVLNSTERLRLFALLIVASGVFEAVYGVIVVLGGKEFDIIRAHPVGLHVGDATGTFANRNHLAGYLQMCLAVGIGLLIAGMKPGAAAGSHETWRSRTRALLSALLGDKGMLRLFLVAMVIGLVMTHSRMGNTAFFASMGICAGIGFLIYRRNSQSMVILFGSMILIDVFIVSAWFGLDKLADRIEQTQMNREGRLEVTNNALAWIHDYWLTGSGSGSFVSVFPSYRDNSVVGFYDFAHNDYLQIGGEYGIVGAGLFALIAASTLWTAVQAQRQRQTPLLRGLGFASMMGMISLMVHSSTDFNLHIQANAALLTVLCALAFIANYMEKQKAGKSKKRRRRSSRSGASSKAVETT